MDHLVSQIADLQADFQLAAERAPWVGAQFTVEPGQILQFGFAHTDGVGPFEDNPPILSELMILTRRAGSMLDEMSRDGLYQLRLFPQNTVPYRFIDHDPLDYWLVFLLHSTETAHFCRTKDGALSACAPIAEG